MTERKDLDPIEMLRAADPAAPHQVSSASLARVSAKVQETIMSDITHATTARPRRTFAGLGIAAGAVAVLALAVTIGLPRGTGSAPGGIAVGPSQSPGGPTVEPTDGGPITGGGMAMCLRYDPGELPGFDVVFDGTVTAVDDLKVTFAVNTAWKGVDGEAITLNAAQASGGLEGTDLHFQVGARFLVSGTPSDLATCGYTRPYDAGDAAAWAAAFGS